MARKELKDERIVLSSTSRRKLLQNSSMGLGGLVLASAGLSGRATADHLDDWDETRIYHQPAPEGEFIHPCNGERMEYTKGYFRIVLHINHGGEDPHIHVTINFIEGVIQGVDNPDLSCRANFVSNATWQGDLHGDPPWTETITQVGTDACKAGKGHDLYKLLLKTTVNANFDTTVEIINGSYECLVDR